MELTNIERRSKRCQADEAAEGDDVNEIEVPPFPLDETLEVLAQTLVLNIRRLFRSQPSEKADAKTVDQKSSAAHIRRFNEEPCSGRSLITKRLLLGTGGDTQYARCL